MATSPQSAAAPLVLESRAGAVVTLALNRPDRLNALNAELALSLIAAVQSAANDKGVRCVVLTGAGRAFCSGGDLKMIADARSRDAGPELESLLRGGADLVRALVRCPKPVVAAVNGPAAGAGMNLALACDIRIASDHASFGQNFAKVGLFPDFGGTFFLPRLAGTAHAAELFWTGEMISAEEAARLHIVSRVVPHDILVEAAGVLAAQLAAAPPLAAHAVKQVLTDAETAELERLLEFEIQTQIRCFASEDCTEGLRAFFEKRMPEFRGK
jgi:enoyl-CoA hydratase/carnithine racemase